MSSQTAIMLLRLFFLLCFAGLTHAEELAFMPLEAVLKDPAWTLTYCSLAERSVTFRSGTLLQPKGQEDNAQSIYVVFLERKLELKPLPAEIRAAVTQNVIGRLDANHLLLNGWSAVALLEAAHPQRPEPLRWLIYVMRSGIITFLPGVELYEPGTETTGGSRLYQAFSGEGAGKFELHIRNEKFGAALDELGKSFAR